MKKKLFSILQYILFLGLGFALLWLVFRKIDLLSVWEEIKNAEYLWIFLALVAAIFSHIFRALRWNLLINNLGYKTRLSTTFYAVMFGYLANTAVPRAGEIGRCGILAKREKIPFDSLFGSVISERIFDLVVLLVLIFLTIIFQLKLVGSFVEKTLLNPLETLFNNNGNNMIILGGIVIVSIFALFFLYKKFNGLLKKSSLFMKFHGFAKGLFEGIKTIFLLKQKVLFLFYTAMVWFCYLIMTWLPFYAIAGTSHLDIAAGMTVLTIGSLGMVAPVPGGIGAYHFIVKAILVQIYGISDMAATVYPTLLHSAQTAMIILIGAASYFILIFDKRAPLNEKNRSNSQ